MPTPVELAGTKIIAPMFASRQTAMRKLYQCMFYTNNIITGAWGTSGAFYLDNSLSRTMIRVDLFVITLSVPFDCVGDPIQHGIFR